MTTNLHDAITTAEDQAHADHEDGTCGQSEWSCSHCEAGDVSDPESTVEGMTTTITGTDIFSAPLFPTRTCEPWCEVGDGHDKQHPEDRACLSTSQHVPLSRHKPERYEDGLWRMSNLTAYLRREYREADAHVVVHCEESDEEIRFSLAEANLLADALNKLLLLEATR